MTDEFKLKGKGNFFYIHGNLICAYIYIARIYISDIYVDGLSVKLNFEKSSVVTDLLSIDATRDLNSLDLLHVQNSMSHVAFRRVGNSEKLFHLDGIFQYDSQLSTSQLFMSRI